MSPSVIVEVRVNVTPLAEEPFHGARPIPKRSDRVRRREHFLRTVESEIHEISGWTFRQRVPARMRNDERGPMPPKELQHLRIEAGAIAKFHRDASRTIATCVPEECVDALEICLGRAEVCGKLQQDRSELLFKFTDAF